MTMSDQLYPLLVNILANISGIEIPTQFFSLLPLQKKSLILFALFLLQNLKLLALFLLQNHQVLTVFLSGYLSSDFIIFQSRS